MILIGKGNTRLVNEENNTCTRLNRLVIQRVVDTVEGVLLVSDYGQKCPL